MALPTDAVINGVGMTATVDLSATGLSAAQAADIEVDFNSAVAIVTGDAVAGPLAASCQLSTNAGTPGTVRIAVACVQSFGDSGVLLSIPFQSVAPGATALTISRCSLNESAIACTPTNGQLTVTVPTPTPSMTATRTATLASTSTASATFTPTATALPALAAAFVGQSVPAAMTAGQQYTVSVTMQNTGTATWTQAGLYGLGAINPYDNSTWGMNRIALASGESVAPGQQKTFSWTVQAPATAGSYNFQWRMVQDGVAWFGSTTPNAVVTVSAPAGPNDVFVSQSVPSGMTAGQLYSVSVTLKNTGTTTWTAAASYRLGAVNPYDNTTWGMSRVGLASGESVVPGQQKTFSWMVRAPATPGTYNFQWRMVQDGVAWFGDMTTNAVVTVSAGPNAAYLSQSVPTAMTAGQQYSVSVTMQNTGGTTWTAAALYRLGAVNPYDNTTWGMSREGLASGESVAPGQQKTFIWTVQAPATPGTYNFQWRMVQDGVAWFGDMTANAVVTVSAPPNAAYLSQSVPTAMTAGQQFSVSVTLQNTGGTTWTAAALYRLGAANPYDNTTWGMSRVGLASGESVAPGQQKTFSWMVRAPATAGTYNFQWRMVQDGVAWFGDTSPNVAVVVQ